MIRRLSWSWSVVLAALAAAQSALAAGVAPRFDLGRPADGPFPSDLFTRSDPEQNTGLSVQLPYADLEGLPACTSLPPGGAGRPSDCDDVDLLNALDGFNVHPRLSIPFDGAIDPASVTSGSVFLVSVGGTLPGGAPAGRKAGITEVVWDEATATLHVKAEKVLDQHARYVLVVTRDVRDAAGDPIERSVAFDRFRHDLAFGQTRDLPPEIRQHLKEYRKALIDGLAAAGVAENDVAVASVFTTMSVTALLEKLHAAVRGGPAPAPADFNLLRKPGDEGPRFVFPVENIARMRWDRGSTAGAPSIYELGPANCDPTSATVPCRVQQLSAVVDAAGRPFVGRIGFGRYDAPTFLDEAARAVPPVKTATGVPISRSQPPVYFNVFLPAGATPAGGWPVVIFGHGQGGNKNEWPFEVAATLASHGLATIAINMVSHGFRPPAGDPPSGPGTITIYFRDATAPITFHAGGRGIDQNNDGRIGGAEGSQAMGAWQLLALSHTRLQTTMEVVQLIRVIEAGVDVDGDGARDLDPGHIGYLGFSGGSYVAVALAIVEPAVRATVFNGMLATMANFRLDPGNRSAFGQVLSRRIPSLLNTPGVASICGVAVGGATSLQYNENLPPRCTSADPRGPIVNEVAGAMAIQEFEDRVEWASQVSAPEALAAYLRKTPLAGRAPARFIYQFARGDRTDVNLNAATFVRAGDLADRTTLYRHDLFRGLFPTSAPLDNPHRFLVTVEGNDGVKQISLQAQEQAAIFLGSDGADVVDPDGALPLFEVPIQTVPDDLGFVGVPAP